MNELSLTNIIGLTFKTLLDSRVLVLMVLEIGILVLSHLFKRLINKKVVNTTSILASMVVLSTYSYKYIDTFKLFIDNVSTKLVEMIYFPTPLVTICIIILSIIILISSYYKNSNKIIKNINTSIVLSIVFIFLCMIEYMSTYKVAFDEYSVFSNPVLMSLNEVITGLFVAWMLILLVYKIDKYILSKIKVEDLSNDNIELPKLKVDVNEEYIELPKLKSNI